MVQTRKQEESSGSGVKMPGREQRASSRDLKGRSDDGEKEDDDIKWSSRNHSRPQRTRRPNIRFEDIGEPPRSRTRRVVYVEHAGSSASEDDSQSDDSIYQVERGRTRRISRFRTRKAQPRLVNISRASNGHSEVSMEEDNPNPEDDGVRRSTRQRKLTYDNLTSSWIMGTQHLRGYPSYRGGDVVLPAAQESCQTRSRERERETRSREAAPDDQEQPPPVSPVLKQASPVLRDRRKMVKAEPKNGSGDEKEAEAGDEEEPEEAEDKASAASSADENDNDAKADGAGEGRQTRTSKSTPGPINNDGFTDMYSRVKRTRRPVMKFSYSPNQSRSKNFAGRGSESHSSSSDDEMEDGDSDHEPVAGKRGRERASVRGSVRTRKYQLRVIKPAVDRFQVQELPVRRSSRALTKELCNTVLRRLRGRPTKRYGSASSSSSDSESRFEHKKAKSLAKARSRCMPLNYHTKDSPQVTGHHTIRSKDGKTANLADVGPMALDTTIRFSHVGGLDDHIRCLQEMVVFPMLYKEIFDKFNITAPKGVLFHGPPGTGKTLIARALANECSQGEHKVKFFMRKGADCLSKWVGESERQLRLLFEQAHQMKPSIIFFDEIDGLAPVRSSKQDQIHASIVSTLLALMDGLDNRGEVIVIGATNRIDAIDPALRRPGRFDRELYFPLPASKERQEILRIHMNKWEQAPSEELLDELAEKAGGYCGSDLRALCAESVVQALRRTYPQIYKSSRKLLLDSDQVQVSKDDFAKAQAGIVPAAHRVCPSMARKLKPLLRPLLGSTVTKVLKQLLEIFPHGLKKEVDTWVTVNRPRLLLTGDGSEFAQTSHVAPAILYHMEHVRVHTLDLSTLYEVSARSPEEAVIQVFQEARRNPPAVIYTPAIGQWWDMIPATVQSVFLLQLRNLDQNSPVLLLSTSDCSYSQLPEQLCTLFSRYRDEVFVMSCPNTSEREAFFKDLFLERATAPPPPPKPTEEELGELPLAPPPEPAKLTEDELGKLYQDEEITLRELRIFLREVCAKLARNRQFFMFTKPVDITEVPDYLEIIEQPMDLETMMTKIDQHHYECAKDFLDDIDLICRNALEYNPDRDPADKLIRHRACFLRDSAYALIKAEMDSDFEVKCKRISQSRQKRGGSPSRFAPAPDFIHTINSAPLPQTNKAQQCGKTPSVRGPGQLVNGDLSSHSSHASAGTGAGAGASPNPVLSSGKKRKKSAWCKGLIVKKKKRLMPHAEEAADKSKSPEANGTGKVAKSSSSQDQSESPPGAATVRSPRLSEDASASAAAGQPEEDCADDSTMSVDEKPPSSTSSPLKNKNGLVNGDVDPAAIIETLNKERTSTGRRSESKDQDGASEEVKSPKASKENQSNKSGLKSALSDSEGGVPSGSGAPGSAAPGSAAPGSAAESSKRRSKSLDSRKASCGTGPASALNTVLVDRVALEKVWHETVEATSSCPAEVVVEVYARLNKCVERYHTVWDRHSLPQELREEMKRFEAHWKEERNH